MPDSPTLKNTCLSVTHYMTREKGIRTNEVGEGKELPFLRKDMKVWETILVSFRLWDANQAFGQN